MIEVGEAPYDDHHSGVMPHHAMQQQRMKMQGPGEAELIVSMQAPYRIQQVSQGLVDLLGFSAMEVTGRSLGVVQGPSTDTMKLNSVIKYAALGNAQAVLIAIYTRAGNSMLMRVSSTPYGRNECKLLFTPSMAVPAKVAMHDDDGLPRVVLSAAAPHIVQSVSQSFSELYGIYGPQIVGRSLHLIHGPRTDMRVWSALVKGALEGQIQCDSLYTCASDCTEFVVDATVTPAYTQDDRISHLICHFSVPPSIPVNNLVFPHQQQIQSQGGGYPGHNNAQYMVNTPETYPSGSNSYGAADHDMFPSNNEVDMYGGTQVIHAHPKEVKMYTHQQQQQQPQQEMFPQASRQPPVMQASADMHSHSHLHSHSHSHSHSQSAQYPLMMPVPEHQQMRPPMTGWRDPDGSHNVLERGVGLFGTNLSMGSMSLGSSMTSMADIASISMGVSAMRDMGRPHQQVVALNPERPCEGDQADSSVSAIFPRRKAGQGKKDLQGKKDWQGPVLITLDVLESMADVALSDAAKKLGVSSTAIKKACRKLGVQRWPYRKANEGSNQTELLAHYNEAYVRKLFRKYSPKVPKEKKAKGSPMAASPSDSISSMSDGALSKPSTPALAMEPSIEEEKEVVVAPVPPQGWGQEDIDPTHHASWLPPGSGVMGAADGGWLAELPLAQD